MRGVVQHSQLVLFVKTHMMYAEAEVAIAAELQRSLDLQKHSAAMQLVNSSTQTSKQQLQTTRAETAAMGVE